MSDVRIGAKMRFVVIVNPRAGARRGLAVLDRVALLFGAAGAELHVRVTERPGQAGEIAATVDLSGCDGLCVIGGDGTIHEVVGGLMRRAEAISTPLGIIPGGTGNSVVRHCDCCNVEDAVRRILHGTAEPLDVIRVRMSNGVAYCVNIVGWGGVVDINLTAERLRLLGPPRYSVAALWNILRPKRRFARLVLDEQIIEDDFVFVMGCNTKFTGKDMLLAPQAEIGDGKIDVVVVRNASRREMWQLFNKVFDGSHLSLSFVEYHQVRSYSIESDNHDLLNLDGELKGETPLSAEVIPAALRILV